jgi:desulfoferrodoxin (superoxide reductase-like protein)
MIVELGNQLADVDVIGNLLHHREPGHHIAQIHLMTKMEMSHS